MGNEVQGPRTSIYDHDDGTRHYYNEYQLADDHYIAPLNEYYEHNYLHYLAPYDRGRINHDDNGGTAINDNDSPVNNHVGPIPVNDAGSVLINDDGTINIPADDYDGGGSDHTPYAPNDGERTDDGPAKA